MLADTPKSDSRIKTGSNPSLWSYAAVTDFTVTMERSAVVRFSEPITRIHHCLFVRTPADRPNYAAYTDPLHGASWAVLGLLVLGAPLLFYAAVK